jgi:hypothetical protein
MNQRVWPLIFDIIIVVPICARTFEMIALERVDLGAGITIGH